MQSYNTVKAFNEEMRKSLKEIPEYNQIGKEYK